MEISRKGKDRRSKSILWRGVSSKLNINSNFLLRAHLASISSIWILFYGYTLGNVFKTSSTGKATFAILIQRIRFVINLRNVSSKNSLGASSLAKIFSKAQRCCLWNSYRSKLQSLKRAQQILYGYCRTEFLNNIQAA